MNFAVNSRLFKVSFVQLLNPLRPVCNWPCDRIQLDLSLDCHDMIYVFYAAFEVSTRRF